MATSNRVLVKLKPNFGLAAAASKVNLRPLHDRPPDLNAFGFSDTPAWYLADLPDTVGPNPWDLAHAQVAEQLGVDESAVLFAEPDLDQTFDDGSKLVAGGGVLGAAPAAGGHIPQDANNNKVTGPFGGPPSFGWHLGPDYTQLQWARSAVDFRDPRTRIAHIDTGFDRSHVARPERIVLEHSFVEGDPDPNKAESRAALGLLPDNLDHGTGTIGILAGGRVNFLGGDFLGGAPEADIVTLRIADSVILFRTSALAQALQFAIDNRCDVVTMSMGGVPSRAWGELVNKAYEAGICICAAAGNNIMGLPSRHVVYPARYHRTIAVCGVMANGKPYDGITGRQLQGSWGPDSSMTSAIAAYTPNIPWPVFKQSPEIRENGEGTSSATPQVAAAAAIWFEKYKDRLPRDWRRVEAVRYALFSQAKDKNADPEHFGNGILQAHFALNVQPDLNRPQTPPDRDSFAILRVLTGLGVADPPPREAMFDLELTQRWLMNQNLQEAVPDPDSGTPVPKDKLRRFMEVLIHDDQASLALRKHVASRYSLVFGTSVKGAPKTVVTEAPAACSGTVTPSNPPYRRIRAYAVDPSLSTRLATAGMNEIALKVRWEKLDPGPVGEYLKVVDVDASGKTYDPVNLNEPALLAQDGYQPSEGNAGFHQQMVYAVAMKTIEHFERALGRPVLWRPRINPLDKLDDSQFERHLEIRPHALRQANAFYSPQDIALLFGYFEASATDPGEHVPGSKVYTCLSHDIVAHETTHAILDGMHRRFNEATNPDVLALHEAFADIVALMQHFTIPEILETEISRTRGNLKAESILGSLALQFGRASGKRGALREAIGSLDANGQWAPLKPDPADFQNIMPPHSRGAILVAAVFDAFIAIYERRTEDLLRIYTGGTGVLPDGAIHPDLVRRLAAEAAKTAGHVLNMCIRALDYIPPVDITFGEYLRGIITADADLVGDDKYNYRVAFIEAFRRRGIYPRDLDTLSVDTLRWQGVSLKSRAPYSRIIRKLKQYADACFYITDREELFKRTWKQRKQLHKELTKVFAQTPEFASQLGLDPAASGTGKPFSFEVHALRRSNRIGPDGNHTPQVVVVLTQSREIVIEGASEKHTFRGGSTIIVDLAKPKVQYAIIKNIDSVNREQRTTEFLKAAVADPVQALLLTPNQRERFAALHALAELE